VYQPIGAPRPRHKGPWGFGGLVLTGLGGTWWAGSVAFVDRVGELSQLVGALGGDARMVLVVGDAGVGKSRFVAEGMARAAAEGMPSVSGACLPLAEKLPLLPVAEAVGELARLEGGRLLDAALGALPPYVRAEVGRLLPQLGPGAAVPDGRGEERQQERLFSAVAELLGAAAGRAGAGLVIEDVHWADSATLDCLTYLRRVGRRGAVTVVVTCRGDESPLEPVVAAWLANARGGSDVEVIRLRPLSREETAEQVAALTGGSAPAQFAEDVYARAEGNPFFAEQLVAAALADSARSGLSRSVGLPARLAELLRARAGRCSGDARAVLNAMVVTGRPLTEEMLGSITRLDDDAVRGGLRELAAVQLLTEMTADKAVRPRHALLSEAVAAGLLPGERVVLHERAARALEETSDDALAAEAAGHWAAAGRPAEELPARMLAADAAERVFGYAQAAGHWLRAIELCQALPGAVGRPGIDLPRLYLRAIDALDASGDGQRAGTVAEEAYRRYAGHSDRDTAAVIHSRAAFFRGLSEPAAGLPLMQEALMLFEQSPPSADQAEAWFNYANVFLLDSEGKTQASRAAMTRALDIAEAVGASTLIPHIMARLAAEGFLRGQVGEGFALLHRGRGLAEASENHPALIRLALNESDALLKLGRFEEAAEIALRGLREARRVGLQATLRAILLAANMAEAMLARGHTSEAAALIDPLTAGAPNRDQVNVHAFRAEIDLLRGDIEAAAERQQQIAALIRRVGSIEFTLDARQRAAELALWAGRPGDALEHVQRNIALFKAPDLAILCGRLLGAGMRACADLAEQARARRDGPAVSAAGAAADGLASWAGQMSGAPFTEHPFVAAIPAERATWDAERTRLAGASDPAAWSSAAKAWHDLGCPHRAGYAWWQQAQADLDAGQSAAAATALRAAAAAAGGHVPLLARIRQLAERARIPLQDPAAATPGIPRSADARVPYGLTDRELTVLRLVAAGRTNAQIGAELYISPKTAGVHVSSILRKLGVSGRVQAAALAERAGLLRPGQD